MSSPRIVILAAACLMLAATALRAEAPNLPARFGANQGEVLEVDRAAGEITIRHGYLPELSMDPMSMVFKVADPAMLTRVRKGDRLTFKAGLLEGSFAVMSIDRVSRAGKSTRRP